MINGTSAEEETKVCTGCREEKPKSEFYKRSASPDGLQHRCKSCTRDAQKKNRLANKLKNANGVDTAGTKFCAECKTEKPKKEFHKSSSRPDGLQHLCKLCARDINKKNYFANKSKNERVDNTTGTKVCSKCRQEKPKGSFYKSPLRRDGLDSRCKSCVIDDNREKRRANKLKHASGVDASGTKACSACKETKPKSEFGKNASTRDGLAYCCNQCAK